METEKIKGELEIDHHRGVIYFHSHTGLTVLRICRLPKPIPELEYDHSFLDITHMRGCSWKGIPREPKPKPPPKPRYHPTKEERERRDKVVELREQGLKFKEIADRYGISEGRASAIYREEMRRRKRRLLKELRSKQP